MVCCKGDAYFNRWRVKVPPFAQLPRCTEEVGDRLWNDPSKHVRFLNDEEVPHEEAMADETSIKQGEIVPFPHEISMQLSQEFIRVFGIELAIVFKVGSGFAFQACIERNIRGIGFCETKEQRTFVFDNVVEWVKSQGLVPVESAPKKPPEIVEFERTTAVAKASPKAIAVAPSPAVNAIVPAAAAATVVTSPSPVVPNAKAAVARGFGNIVL